MKRLNEKIIFKTKLFTIKDILLELDNGKQVTYQIMEKGDTSLIVPLKSNGNLVLVKEYFYAIDEYQLGLPKGRIEENEEPLKTANKELQEEIGYKASTLDELSIVTMSPGYLTQKTHIFLARDLEENKLDGDEPEALEVVEYPFSDFENLIDNGQITEARMISALYLARKFLSNN